MGMLVNVSVAAIGDKSQYDKKVFDHVNELADSLVKLTEFPYGGIVLYASFINSFKRKTLLREAIQEARLSQFKTTDYWKAYATSRAALQIFTQQHNAY